MRQDGSTFTLSVNKRFNFGFEFGCCWVFVRCVDLWSPITQITCGHICPVHWPIVVSPERKCEGIAQHMLIRRHWRKLRCYKHINFHCDCVRDVLWVCSLQEPSMLLRAQDKTCPFSDKIWESTSTLSNDTFLKQKSISLWPITVSNPWHFCGWRGKQPFYKIVFDWTLFSGG